MTAANVNGVVTEAGPDETVDRSRRDPVVSSDLTSAEFADLKTIAANLNTGLSTSALSDLCLQRAGQRQRRKRHLDRRPRASGALGNLAAGANPTQTRRTDRQVVPGNRSAEFDVSIERLFALLGYLFHCEQPACSPPPARA